MINFASTIANKIARNVSLSENYTIKLNLNYLLIKENQAEFIYNKLKFK